MSPLAKASNDGGRDDLHQEIDRAALHLADAVGVGAIAEASSESGRCSCRRRAGTRRRAPCRSAARRSSRPRSRHRLDADAADLLQVARARRCRCTTTQNTSGAMIILISLMKPSPKRLQRHGEVGDQTTPMTTPRTSATTTWPKSDLKKLGIVWTPLARRVTARIARCAAACRLLGFCSAGAYRLSRPARVQGRATSRQPRPWLAAEPRRSRGWPSAPAPGPCPSGPRPRRHARRRR